MISGLSRIKWDEIWDAQLIKWPNYSDAFFPGLNVELHRNCWSMLEQFNFWTFLGDTSRVVLSPLTTLKIVPQFSLFKLIATVDAWLGCELPG